MSRPLTPSQTVGPFLSIGLPWDEGPFASGADAPDAIRISGRLLDGAGEPIPDGLVETWQADPPAFTRSATADDGTWLAVTPAPRSVDGQAPHLAVNVLARGLLHRLVTRIYFADRAEENAADPVLGRVPADRRGTLLAEPAGAGYRFDIRIQGPGETVFFDL